MIDSTDPTWYAARDASSPSELAAIYGEANVAWMPANTSHYQRMISGDQRYALRFGWATYLENARIRETTQGEGRDDAGRPCWHGATTATCAVDMHNGEQTRCPACGSTEPDCEPGCIAVPSPEAGR